MKHKTEIAHPRLVLSESDNPPLVEPIYQSTAFTFDPPEELSRLLSGERSGFLYSRITNPTTAQLEQSLASLQQRESALVVSSGVAAITLALYGLLQAGETVAYFSDSYKTSRDIIRQTLSRHGITSIMLSADNPRSIARTLKKRKVRALLLESPTNPMTRVLDLEWLTATARASGVYTILDNTFAGPHQHQNVEADIFLHSLSKYINGHGDVFGGALIGKSELINSLRVTAAHFGACLDPHAAFLISRGLKTFILRYTEHCQNALAVAQFLETHPKVKRVWYPGLASHPQHQLASRQMQQFGGILAAELETTPKDLTRFFSQLRLFSLSGGLGSTDSLIAPVEYFYGSDLSTEEKQSLGISPTVVRLSVGLEAQADLVEDLQQALELL